LSTTHSIQPRRATPATKAKLLYLDKVKGSGLCSEKKEIDVAAQKQILGLLFKKFIIKRSGKSTAADCRIIPFWQAPFDKLAPGKGSDEKCRRYSKKAADFILKRTADPWAAIYHRLKRALEKIYKNAF